MRTTALALVLLAGCGGHETAGSLAGVTGTVASLSPGSGPTVVALQWFDDEGLIDTTESGGGMKVTDPLPAMFAFAIGPPKTQFILDFDALRALPTCSSTSVGQCWTEGKPRLQGRGRLAIGSFLAFDDTDGNGQYTRDPQPEPIRGFGPLYVLYAEGLDAQAIKELGEQMVINPQRLGRNGTMFARVRCKAKVGWPGRFDPFEVVDPEEITVESLESFEPRAKAGEFCNNWS
jgi:hypothetical protein